MNRSIGYVLSGTIFLLLLSPAIAKDNSSISPDTSQGQRALKALKHAAEVDRMDAQSYRGGEDNAAATYYNGKAREADALARELERGAPVSANDLQHALQNRNANRYTGGY
jgi:hypothetical protein